MSETRKQCLHCGEHARVLDETTHTHTLECPGCDVGPDRQLKHSCVAMLAAGVVGGGITALVGTPEMLSVGVGCVSAISWFYFGIGRRVADWLASRGDSG